MPPRRGEVWLFDLGVTAKTRRVLLVAQSGQGVGLFVPRTHVAAEQPERATVGR